MLKQFFLREVGMVAEQFFPGGHRAIDILLAFPLDNANVHQRARVFGIVSERLVELRESAINISRVVQA